MSPAATWDATIIVEQAFDLRLDALCSISASVLLFYDYLLTLDKEAGLFWKKKISGASLLFLCNRYLTLLTRVSATVDLCQYVPWAVFSGLRAHALSRHTPLGILVFLLSLGPDVVNLIKLANGVSGIFSGPVWAVESCAEGGADIMPLPQQSCIDYARTSSCDPKYVIISRCCLITADVILLLITWISLWRTVIYVSGKPTRLPFTKVLLRDGTIYFIIILTMNILHLAFALPSVSVSHPTEGTHSASSRNFSQITVFTKPITAILVSRFLIDLQEANQRSAMVPSDDLLHFSTAASSNTGSLRFASVVSSLGATFSSLGVSESDIESEEGTCEGELEDGTCMENISATHRGTWSCEDDCSAGTSQRDARSTPSPGATLVVVDAHDP
ncbi:hypothetical protein OH76DRAFT_134940 [Lentinus brumalis]|uniref:DUF6533 domain-containing protein n=1 Tax=Lentinus brumalis TaxID=2498619 RepID=A0A371DK78_9APHY|nr:hypothetical protein OH76DRAFT_134940 [Polyporus brumalis]